MSKPRVMGRFGGPKIVQPVLNQKVPQLVSMSPDIPTPPLALDSVVSENSNQIIKSHLPIKTPRSEMDLSAPLLHSVSSLIFDLTHVLIFDVEPKIAQTTGDTIHEVFIDKCQQCRQICDFTTSEHETVIPLKTEILQDIFCAVSDPKIVQVLDEVDYRRLYECIGNNIFRVPPDPPAVWFAPISIDFSLDKVEEAGWEHMTLIYDIGIAFFQNRQFNQTYCNPELLQISKKIVQIFKSPDVRERDKLTKLYHAMYRSLRKLRPELKHLLESFLREFHHHPTLGGTEILTALVPIIVGFKQPLHGENVTLFNDLLLPLHSSSRLPFYHVPFISAVIAFLQKQSSLVDAAIDSLLLYWPKTSPPKTVLFLNELEQLMPFIKPDSSQLKKMYETVAQSITDSSFAISERALMMWESDPFMQLIESNPPFAFSILVPSIFHTATMHWCDEVKTLALSAMRVMKGVDSQTFEEIGTKLKTYESGRIMAEIEKGSLWGDLVCQYLPNKAEQDEMLDKLSTLYIGCECLASSPPPSQRVGKRKASFVPLAPEPHTKRNPLSSSLRNVKRRPLI